MYFVGGVDKEMRDGVVKGGETIIFSKTMWAISGISDTI